MIAGMEVNCWDVGGRSPMRPLFRHYYQSAHGIVFVIDSADVERYEDAIDELRRVLAEEALMGVPLLILANKSDLPRAMNAEQFEKATNIHSVVGSTRSYRLQSICAMRDDKELRKAMSWLKQQIEAGSGQSVEAIPLKRGEDATKLVETTAFVLPAAA